MEDLKQRIVISYDPINRAVEIEENDFLTFDAFGVLEAAKQMIANNWLKKDDEKP